MIAFRLAQGVKSHFITRLPEWLLAGQIGLAGLQLLRSDDTFLRGNAYRVIAQFVSEVEWGGAALCISLFWLTALILNGTFEWFARWSRWIRSLSAFIAAGFWSLSVVGTFEANSLNPAPINNLGYAVMAFLVSLITAREVGAADRKVKDAAAGAK